MAIHDDIPIAELRQVLRYDPETGHLWWRKSGSGRNLDKPAGAPRKRGDILIRYKDQRYRAHRLAWALMKGEYPPGQVDHRDLNASNNVWLNLRLADNAQNNSNRPKMSNNTSGYKGVSWHKKREKWRATIQVRGAQRDIGFFATPEEAYEAYKAAAAEGHGEFAHF